MKRSILLALVFILGNTVLHAKVTLATGMWYATLTLNDTTNLPFYFAVKKTKGIYQFEFRNGEERIIADEIRFEGDSVFIKMPVFDSEFRCLIITSEKIQEGASITGNWINHARKDKNIFEFRASLSGYEPKFTTDDVKEKDENELSGKWEATFSPGTTDSYKAVAIFKFDGNLLGTFLTETGDYRYLFGAGDPNGFWLSCFDGAHAFYFSGSVKADGTITGDYYSGMHWHEKWIAKRNAKFELRNPDSLTYLKPGFDKVDFKFKNLDGKEISLSDEKFKDKVVIVQLMGSWCPNCMDETKFFADLYSRYKTKGVEIVALAFEKMTDAEKAKSNLQRLQKKYNVQYEILITEKTGKDQASDVLPMLNSVMAFPTTIYIDKKGRVRKIYTGFSGPGTGSYYDKWVENTTSFIDKLLSE